MTYKQKYRKYKRQGIMNHSQQPEEITCQGEGEMFKNHYPISKDSCLKLVSQTRNPSADDSCNSQDTKFLWNYSPLFKKSSKYPDIYLIDIPFDIANELIKKGKLVLSPLEKFINKYRWWKNE